MTLTSLLPYLIIIGVVSLIIAPVMWMQPTPRQKELEKFRIAARAVGLLPQIVPKPDELMFLDNKTVAKYSLHVTEKGRNLKFGKQYFWPPSKRYIEDSWSDAKGRPVVGKLRTILEQMPASSYLLELEANRVSLYWREDCDENLLKKISGLFTELLEHSKKVK